MTKSLEDYLEEIHVLIHAKGAARVRDVALALHVKMPSVVKAIGELKKLGLATQEPYGNIELTEKGARVAAHVLGRHSAETMERVQDFLGKNATARTKTAKTAAKKGTDK